MLNTAKMMAALFLGLGFFSPALKASDDKIAFGEYLASECVTCHQLSGADSGIPAIIGWDEESFIAVLNSYKNKARDNQVMQMVTATLTDEEIAALAAYFATIKE